MIISLNNSSVMTLKRLVIFVFIIKLLIINLIIYLKNFINGNSQLDFNFLLIMHYMARFRRCLSFLLYLHKKNNKNVKRRRQKSKTKNKKRNKHTFHMKLNPWLVTSIHIHKGINASSIWVIPTPWLILITNEFMDNEM